MATNTYVGVGGVHKKANNIYVGVGGVYKKCKNVYVGVGGVWKKTHQSVAPLNVTIPASGSDNQNTPSDASYTIIPVITGGVEPYTKLWQLVSSNSADIANSSVAGTNLTLTLDMDSTGTRTETWRLRVTDALGTIFTSGNCVVTLTIDP